MKLLEPLQLKNITFKNRVMFPPMSTGYTGKEGVSSQQSVAFYERLAKGGVGYIVIGNVASSNALAHASKITTDEYIPQWKMLADTLHRYDCKLGIQLFFVESDADKFNRLVAEGKMAEARASMEYDKLHFTNEVPTQRIYEMIEDTAQAAVRAKKAGIDVIQIHGDRFNGALLSTKLNHRTDEFGGSFENRARFAVEVVKAIKRLVPDMTIEYKMAMRTLNPDGSIRGNGGMIFEESVELGKLLEEAGVEIIHVAQSNHTSYLGDTIPPMGAQPYGFTTAKYCDAFRQATNCTLSCVGRLITPQTAEAVLQRGTADMVGLGRTLLADPDFVNKCMEGRQDEIRQCIMCNKGCTDSICNRGFINCVLNPENGYEAVRHIMPAVNVQKVGIIGGGMAGMEAARVAAVRGHDVTLMEKDYRLGGQVNLASVPPRKAEMNRAIMNYERILPKLGVKIKLGCDALNEDLNEFDSLIVATGAENIIIPVPGHDNENVFSSWDVLAGRSIVFGKVAVIGGGLVGVETAEYLAHQGADVTVIEMLDGIAKDEGPTVKPLIMADLEEHNVKIMVNTKLKAIEADRVICDVAEGEETKTIEVPMDFTVMAVGARGVKLQIPESYKGKVFYAGDCADQRPSNISHATKTGYDIANSFDA